MNSTSPIAAVRTLNRTCPPPPCSSGCILTLPRSRTQQFQSKLAHHSRLNLSPTPAQRLPLDRRRLPLCHHHQHQHLRRVPQHQRRAISTYGYIQSKALVYHTYGEPRTSLKLHSYSISPPTSSKISLRMLAAPINPADVNQIQGSYPTKPALTTILGTSEPSAVGGNEGVAEVVATGGAVERVKKGDWVVPRRPGMGTWRTHLQVEEDEILKVDDIDRRELSPLQIGTATVNPITAYRMLKDYAGWSFRGEGEWFVQNGANSAVGRAAIQLGREWGLKSINVIRDRPGSDRIRSELECLGATQVVLDSEITTSIFPSKVADWTNNHREPIRLALNCVGGKPATSLAKLLDPDGHMVTYGAMSKQPTLLPTSLLIFKNITLDGFWLSRWADAHPTEKRQTVADVLRMMRARSFQVGPVDELPWGPDTAESDLRDQVQTTLESYRKGKGIFNFTEM